MNFMCAYIAKLDFCTIFVCVWGIKALNDLKGLKKAVKHVCFCKILLEMKNQPVDQPEGKKWLVNTL